MRKLVITEKANAARRISTILSGGKTGSKKHGGVSVLTFSAGDDEYSVVSLRGHIIELDYPAEYGDWGKFSPVDMVYAPQEKKVKIKSILDAIKSIADQSDMVIIATDYDREGELIGMETVKYAGIDLSKVRRAKFSALTKGEVDQAFSNLVEPDEKLADAAEARQIIDLSWGAVLTRLISLSSGQVGKNFMSVGRVQSPTLKLLVDRDAEITAFEPVPYWTVGGRFGMLAFRGAHESNPFWKKEEADAVMKKCEGVKKGTVRLCETKLKEEYRPPPFDTTQLQVEANKIGIPPAVTMKLAEDLYTAGYISYPRTENTEYPISLGLKNILERLKDSDFAKEATEILAQEKISPSRGKRRTTDHPPIHPTSGARSSAMKGDKWKLYELIVRRFLATLAPNAEAEVTECLVDVNGETFKAEGYVLRKEGWKKYYGQYLRRQDARLDRMKVGDSVDVRSMGIEEDETKPPYRYNQGSLIQEMDRLNLGTKSTRHDIIGKLYSRNYVQGAQMIPTASGIALTRSLEKHGGGIAEPGMTSKLEKDMLEISSGEKTLQDVVGESQGMLHKAAKKIEGDRTAIGDEIRAALRSQQHLGICNECGGNMTIKKSRNGNFIGCDNYPECRESYPLPRGAMIQTVEDVCGVCGLPMLKVIRRGFPPSIQCIDPKCASNMEKNDLGSCPACGKGRIHVMYSKAGKRFAGCTEWPDCKQTYPLRPRGSLAPGGGPCLHCGAPTVASSKGDICISMECPGKKKRSA